ncbi:PEPxxWA-CTERM sorting domain-containing protein [Novosphingobium sp.]|uniref:PEPxxWA-CTERM sorting domain-containing protein n=1 Tax=Novosphingobium sp. TaxID=1874826 RepID=UPI003D0B7B13
MKFASGTGVGLGAILTAFVRQVFRGDFFMRTKIAAFATGVLMVAVAPWAIAPAQAAEIVYSINLVSEVVLHASQPGDESGTVVGTITTNGTLAGFTRSDITSFDLKLIDNENSSYNFELTPSNATIDGTYSGLRASATDLSFDFADPSAFFLIQPQAGGNSSGMHYFCLAGSPQSDACPAGISFAPFDYKTDGVGIQNLDLAGVVSIASVQSPSVPEPSTWAMMLVGFGMVGFGQRRRSRKVARVSFG